MQGVSGLRVPLRERPEGRRLFDMLRAGDTLVVRWVDRLGRNYSDVTDTIRAFMARGVIVRTVINGLVFDGATKDPIQKAVRDALIAFMAATAEAAGRGPTREAERAGIARAKATEPPSYRGRKPSFDRAQLGTIRGMLAQDASPTVIAEAAGVSRQVVYRVQDDPVKAEAMLAEWGM
jgi:putative DNA-invertase from lambdoid prophage Rac